MMKKALLGISAVLLGVGLSTSALAHDSIGFSLNIGQPYYYEPAPVYYAAPPVVYYEPRYEPRPVYRSYYSESPTVYYYPQVTRYYDRGGWRGHHGHHRHHDRDDD